MRAAATVLVVDDDPSQRVLVRTVLAQDGLAVHDTGDPCAVEALVTRLRPDLVLLDWIMPERSGLEVCRAVSESGEAGAVAILTSLDDTRDRSAARAAGAAAFLPKGLAADELVAAVRSLLPAADPGRFDRAAGTNVTAL